ncbi:MAG: hypothetical protein AAGG01_10555, partial [Planctomycetota bacterium]
WTLHAKSTASSSFDDFFLVNGQLVLREFFSTLPWDPSQGYRGSRSRINDSGQVALAAETSSSTTSLAVGQGVGLGSWTLIHEDGDAVAGTGGGVWSALLNPTITVDGRVAVVGELDGGREAAVLDGALIALAQSTVPAGSSSGAAFDEIGAGTSGFSVSADGAHWSTLGFVGGVNAAVADGTVMLEVGERVPNSGFTRDILRIGGQHLDPAGRFYGWGLNRDDGRDWVVRDGVVIAEEFDPIVPGSSEQWGNASTLSVSFSHVVGHRSGDFLVVGGTRQGPGQVVVRGGQEVVARTGDPLDLDGNGAFDDDVFLASFRSLGGWGDNGALYAVVSLRTASGGALGDAVVRFDIPPGSFGDIYCTSAPNSTGIPASVAATGSDVLAANNLGLTCGSLPQNSFGYFLTSQVQGSSVGAGGSQGTLCLSGQIGRGVGGGAQFSGSLGAVSVTVDLTALPTPAAGPVAASVGETWSFQYWYRDANPGVTSNFSPGIAITLR